MAIRTIIVALTLEDDSRNIADRAVQLANSHGAQLIGMHVIEHPEYLKDFLTAGDEAHSLPKAVIDERAQKLQAFLSCADRPPVLKVKVGKPYVAIEAAVRSFEADLVVMGPGVAENLGERIFGSTSDRVVRCSASPVLIVRTPARALYRRIVVGFDFSVHAKAAAAFAPVLEPTAKCELIHAVEVPLTFEQAMRISGTSQKDIIDYRRSKAREALERFREMYTGNHTKNGPRLRIVYGSPAATLLALSGREADLVAVGTQGSHAIMRHLLGNVAQKILVGAKSDVLVTFA